MILEKIVAKVKSRVEQQKKFYPVEVFQQIKFNNFKESAFKQALSRPGIQIIAEIKKASPSAGIIAQNFDPVKIAKDYQAADVAAISVLTEQDFFQGSLEILQKVKSNVSIPILRKDFIIDPYQIYQAKYFGACCILLIVSILTEKKLSQFLELANEMKLDTLVEVHDGSELETALKTGAKIIGINNRDLKTFNVDINITFKLKQYIPADKIVVSESGIKNHEQVAQLEEAGVDAILVGESMMRSEAKKEMVRYLLYGESVHEKS